MRRIHLVRHGEAAGGWGDDPDPGLSPAGQEQAAAVAEALAPIGPLPVVVSPLRRARETAAPLAARWGVEPVVDPRVGEIVAPTEDFDERAAWLRDVFGLSWGHPRLADWEPWRAAVIDALIGLPGDTVVVTHYVPICAAIGAATGDDRFACAMPANCSVTVLESDGSSLRLADLGAQVRTVVR